MRHADQYRDPMARESDDVDRAAWAALLGELLASAGMTPEQAAQPAGPVSVNWRTIRKWLRQEKDGGVSVAKIRDVCRDLNYPVLDALVRVGFITAEEARLAREPIAPAPPLPRPLRQIADVLTDRRVPDAPKGQLRQAVQAAFDLWAGMYRLRPPRERPAQRDRTSR